MSDKKNPVSTQANLSIKEKLLKNVFIAGLNSDNQPVAEKYGEDLPLENGLSRDNQLEAGRCRLDLPLDELVARLSALENLTNQDK
ncbi:hypothetical protein Glove_207g21 [Diversispora epigaea]|uniref:Uncharacterized protein n=1 Tax=Diversispora epigaea TaxID=1348612 RepID=A0A397IML0_9GLOM|nr:hypothetical protein Glove_207g21 [Diversispora epigaea]